MSASAGTSRAARDARRSSAPLVGFSRHALRGIPRRDLVIRFVFGAAISATAEVVGLLAGTQPGGILLAFPAILPATLTLLEKEESEHKAADDDLGAILGSVALVAFALVAWLLLGRAGGATALVLAAATWLVTGSVLYLGLRLLGPRH